MPERRQIPHMIEFEMLPSEYIAVYAKYKTRSTKQAGIKKYLSAYLNRPCSDVDADMVEYLSSRDSATVARDLIAFPNHPSVVGLAPMTKHTYTRGIEGYFVDCCGFALTPLQRKLRKRAQPERAVAVTRDVSPTREMMRELLLLSDPRLRAEILVSLSGGLRISEVMSLRLADVFLDETPCRVELQAANTKTGFPRHTFLSSEAAGAVRAYLRVRDEQIRQLRTNSRRVHKSHVIDESLLFPWSVHYERQRLVDLIDSSTLNDRDPRTGRHTLHHHSFRKYFLTQAKRSARADYVEAWAGHTGYLAASYLRPSLDDERAEYLKAELDLTILIPDDYLKIRREQADELQRLQQMLAANQEVITQMQGQLTELRARSASRSDWVKEGDVDWGGSYRRE